LRTSFKRQNRGPETEAAHFLELHNNLFLVSVYCVVSNGPFNIRLFTSSSRHWRFIYRQKDIFALL
jgi:hypothetical protein